MAKQLENLRKALVKHQIERLNDTYRDFVEKKNYGKVTRFFFEDVYSIEGKDERDVAFKKIYQKFKGKLGRSIAQNMRKLISLNELSDQLDLRVVKKLHEMGLDVRFTGDEYEEAYYLTDVYPERVKQIELIVESIRYFHGLAQYRSVGMTLAVIRPYALLRGARNMVDFLQKGYKACRSVDSVEEFVKAITKRETKRLDRIYSLGKRPPTIKELRKRAKEMGIKGADRMTLRRMMREMQKWT